VDEVGCPNHLRERAKVRDDPRASTDGFVAQNVLPVIGTIENVVRGAAFHLNPRENALVYFFAELGSKNFEAFLHDAFPFNNGFFYIFF
jgi:hypothetical protein